MKLKYVGICFLFIVLISGCVEEEVKPIKESPAPLLEEEIEKAVIEVNLTSDKLMVPSDINTKKGDIVKWFNNDEKFYHNVIIYPADIERPKAADVVIQSGNIDPGDYWEYVFEESGVYIVKDIYSGTMRGMITTETIRMTIEEVLERGEVIGRINVE